MTHNIYKKIFLRFKFCSLFIKIIQTGNVGVPDNKKPLDDAEPEETFYKSNNIKKYIETREIKNWRGKKNKKQTDDAEVEAETGSAGNTGSSKSDCRLDKSDDI